MENKNIKESADDVLLRELKNAEVDYNKSIFEHAAQGISNPLTLREMRRDIARYKTEIRSRQVANFTPAQINKRSKIRARRRK